MTPAASTSPEERPRGENSGRFVDFSGRRVVVSGASSGIGRAVAVELGAWGAELILIGRNEETLAETARLAGSAVTHILPLDLSKTALIREALGEVTAKHGRIYGLCHAAGIVETRPLSAFRADTFQAMMDVNVTAGLELARAVSRADVVAEEGGSIVWIASAYGWVGMPGQIGYSATKGAVIAAARAMAVELARKKIRVNTISPGFVATAMTEGAFGAAGADKAREIIAAHPLGAGTAADVARTVAFLLAPQTGWITGSDLAIDGGFTAR